MRDRSGDLLDPLLDHRPRRWWRDPAGISLCSIIGIGEPMHVHLFGSHLWSDVGPIAGVLALFAAATIWLFRRYGGQDRPEIAPDSDRIWAELEACGCDPSCDPSEDDPHVVEPREREPIRA
ncbi:MAG: hypothetical protein R3343_04190 [Nitriliruptorales bacterium]|nr:hypothetical protein [Nitriliruptorales bacterium]